MQGRRNCVIENLLSKASAHRHKCPNAAAQSAIFLDGDECPRTGLQTRRKLLRQRKIRMCSYMVFNALTCESHIVMLSCAQFGNCRIFCSNKLRRIVVFLVPPRHGKGGNGIAHTKRALIAVQVCIQRCTVKGPREHPQPVQSAMPRRLGKAARNLQK